jgi:transposase
MRKPLAGAPPPHAEETPGRAAGSDTDNQGEQTKLAAKARTLISRFRRFEDMILRFATALSAPFTSNEAERSCRPVKV